MQTRITIAFLIIALFPTPGVVWAEAIGFGTSSSGGPIYHMAAAIGTVTSINDAVEFRLRPHTGTGQMLPVVDSGELSCGAANALELKMAHTGSAIYKGKTQSNLRLVGVGYPFRLASIVAADSEATKAADLRGMRVPGPYKAAPIADILIDALLANAGLSTADVKQVPVAGFRDAISGFDAGRIDVMVDVVSPAYLKRLEQKVGKLRVLSLDPSPAAVAAMLHHVPVARAEQLDIPPEFTVTDGPIYVMAYDFMVFCNKDVENETIAIIARVLHSQRAELARIVPSFSATRPDAVAPDIGVPYHPGAIRYYQDAGVWKGI